MINDPFSHRIPPRPTWFHSDPDIAVSELVVGGYRRVSEWKPPSMNDAIWRREYLTKAVRLYEMNYLILDPRGAGISRFPSP